MLDNWIILMKKKDSKLVLMDDVYEVGETFLVNVGETEGIGKLWRCYRAVQKRTFGTVCPTTAHKVSPSYYLDSRRR